MNKLQFNIKALKEDRETKEQGGKRKDKAHWQCSLYPKAQRLTSFSETALKMPAFKCV